MKAQKYIIMVAALMLTGFFFEAQGAGELRGGDAMYGMMRPQPQPRPHHHEYDFQYSARIRRFHQPYTTFTYYAPVYTETYWYNYTPYTWGVSIYGDEIIGVGNFGYPVYAIGYNPYEAAWYNPYAYRVYSPVIVTVRVNSRTYYTWNRHYYTPPVRVYHTRFYDRPQHRYAQVPPPPPHKATPSRPNQGLNASPGREPSRGIASDNGNRSQGREVAPQQGQSNNSAGQRPEGSDRAVNQNNTQRAPQNATRSNATRSTTSSTRSTATTPNSNRTNTQATRPNTGVTGTNRSTVERKSTPSTSGTPATQKANTTTRSNVNRSSTAAPSSRTSTTQRASTTTQRSSTTKAAPKKATTPSKKSTTKRSTTTTKKTTERSTSSKTTSSRR